MESHEIDVLVAEKVMGFKWAENNYKELDYHPMIWKGKLNGLEYSTTTFKPTKFLHDALMVLDKYEGYEIQKNPYSNLHQVKLITFKNGPIEYIANAELLQAAICLAALKSEGVEI
ncbi:hypothetical protein [Bacillus sp. SM2101]|uniref:BC1872 family protein n=1 Tax=Bacillus sp. SM2101 TaxID=2805366 RepID=UPI001BDE04D4